MNADCVAERQDASVPESSKAGGHALAPMFPEDRNFIGFLSKLPRKEEWKDMGSTKTYTMLQDMMSVYGQLGVRMAGCVAACRKELLIAEEARDVLRSTTKKEQEMEKLQKKLADLRVSIEYRINKMKASLKTATDALDKTEGKLKRYKAELKKVQDELKSRRPKEEVLEEFRHSNAYATKLSWQMLLLQKFNVVGLLPRSFARMIWTPIGPSLLKPKWTQRIGWPGMKVSPSLMLFPILRLLLQNELPDWLYPGSGL